MLSIFQKSGVAGLKLFVYALKKGSHRGVEWKEFYLTYSGEKTVL